MGLNEWLALIGALGGFEAIKWIVNFYVNRRTNTRKEDATADSMEDENDRIAQRDAKIDAIYVELRQEQSAHLEDIHKKHELELRLKEAEIKKCDVHGCTNRQPPSDY